MLFSEQTGSPSVVGYDTISYLLTIAFISATHLLIIAHAYVFFNVLRSMAPEQTGRKIKVDYSINPHF
jgi:hypothetical protein